MQLHKKERQGQEVPYIRNWMAVGVEPYFAYDPFSDADTPIRQVCREFKSLVKGYIQELCRKAGAKNPNQFAEEMSLLFEGAIVTAQVSQNPQVAQIAKRASKALIEKALFKKP